MANTPVRDKTTTKRYQVGKLPRNEHFREAQGKFKDAVYATHEVDSVTRELVRMLNGIIQDCHFCMSLRSAMAIEEGLTEDMMQDVHNYEASDLSERQKVALRFADAYLLHPAEVSDELKADMQKYYKTEEILELIIRLTHNTINRIGRAFGTDQDEIKIQITHDF